MVDYAAARNPSRCPTHPGALLNEVIPATGKSKAEIATLLGISRQHLYDILKAAQAGVARCGGACSASCSVTAPASGCACKARTILGMPSATCARRSKKSRDSSRVRPDLEPAATMAKPQHLFSAMLARVHAASAPVLGPAADLSRVVVEPPRDPTHGDMATNAAMVLAKDAGKKPRELAEAIAEKLRAEPTVEKVDVAGPGFINLTLKSHVWAEELRVALAAGKDYGRSDIGKGDMVNVEYVSANPTGPMHIGHGRGAVFGDALASLLEYAGYAVTREYYINDAGAQVDALARSAYLRYREALGEDIGAIPEGLYPGDYLRHVGGELAAEYGTLLTTKPEAEWLPLVRAKAVGMMMDGIRADLAALNVHFDVYFSERSLIEAGGDQVAATIEALRKSGEVYEGRLPPPKRRHAIEDWEDREQTLFKSDRFRR